MYHLFKSLFYMHEMFPYFLKSRRIYYEKKNIKNKTMGGVSSAFFPAVRQKNRMNYLANLFYQFLLKSIILQSALFSCTEHKICDKMCNNKSITQQNVLNEK